MEDLSEFVKYFVLISVYICVVKVIWREAVVLVMVVPEVGRPPVRRWGWDTTPCTPPPPMAVQEVMESLGVSNTKHQNTVSPVYLTRYNWIYNWQNVKTYG